MENRRHLQCKALQSHEKRRRRKSKWEAMKEQCEDNGNNEKSGRVPTLRRGRGLAEPSLFVGFGSLGAIPTLPFMPLAQIENTLQEQNHVLAASKPVADGSRRAAARRSSP